MHFDFSDITSFRYLTFAPTPFRIAEIIGYCDGKQVDRSSWRASNLYSQYVDAWNLKFYAKKAWYRCFTLNNIPENSYLSIAINGKHGVEGAYAALKVNGKYVGCPDRSPSFP